jgi:peptide deformylase
VSSDEEVMWMVLRIRTEGSEILRKKARPVASVNRSIKRLAEDMLETMYKARGAGLAAPQIGRDIRLVVMDIGEGPLILVNPKLTSSEGSVVDVEACLSIPGVSGKVARAKRVFVEGLDLDGKTQLLEAEGFLARVIQHEVDHLDVVLFIDRATDIVRETGESE